MKEKFPIVYGIVVYLLLSGSFFFVPVIWGLMIWRAPANRKPAYICTPIIRAVNALSQVERVFSHSVERGEVSLEGANEYSGVIENYNTMCLTQVASFLYKTEGQAANIKVPKNMPSVGDLLQGNVTLDSLTKPVTTTPQKNKQRGTRETDG